MIEVEITDKMKRDAQRKAREMGVIKNSIEKGGGSIAGFLGEFIANEVIGGKVDNTYEYDIVYNNITYDVKTKRCTSPPRDYYDCSVADFNTKQKCERYVFVRIENKGGKWGRAWVLGWKAKSEYYAKSRKMTKGEVDKSNGFIVKADCHNLAIKELEEF